MLPTKEVVWLVTKNMWLMEVAVLEAGTRGVASGGISVGVFQKSKSEREVSCEWVQLIEGDSLLVRY
jgi:hypothetical protein